MNSKINSFFDDLSKWKDEMFLLRELTLDCDLQEELKWGVPCYTYKGANILIIHGFKEYCALNFFNGVLLEDTEGLLIQQTENVQTGRQIRFSSLKEIVDLVPVLKAYIYEAIEVEKAGIKPQLKNTSDFEVPVELERKFQENAAFKDAFEALTPGRQRGYLLQFSKPKQSKTRSERIEKYTQRIFDEKGFHDCVCGMSKRMPNCDGSHKNLK